MGQLALAPLGEPVDVSLELLLKKGEGGIAELTVIGARQPTGLQVGPQIVFGAVLETGDGWWAPAPASDCLAWPTRSRPWSGPSSVS